MRHSKTVSKDDNDTELVNATEKLSLTDLITIIVKKEILPLQEHIQYLEEENKKIQTLEMEVKDLRSKVHTQKASDNVDVKLAPIQKILENHQRCLDKDDVSKREANLIVIGVPESNDDSGKITSILEAVECPNVIIKKVVRLGKLNEDRGTRQRPILVVAGSVTEKKKILKNKGKLKTAGNEYKHIYIKTDQSLALRKEWTHLKEVIKKESKAPINKGCNYKIDFKKGELLRDGIVIDKFQSPFRQTGPNL